MEFVSPIFYGLFFDGGGMKELIRRKYIYYHKQSTGGHTRGVGITTENGILEYDTDYFEPDAAVQEKMPVQFLVGGHYYFYVSDILINNFDYEKLASGYYSYLVIIRNERNLDIYHGRYNIGNQSIVANNPDSGKPMLVRVHGKGSQKGEWPIIGTRKAILFIGGLHRNELGGIAVVKIMEDYIQEKSNTNSLIPDDTTVFVLNPVHSPNLIPNESHREIRPINSRSIDPNREFTELNIAETRNIDEFIRNLLQPNNYSSLFIISGHRYNNDLPSNSWRRSADGIFPGIILPLYNINIEGVELEIFEAAEYKNNRRTGNRIQYTIPQISEKMASEREGFGKYTEFAYETIWRRKENEVIDYEIYPKEFMHYLNTAFPNDVGTKINMIEFEIPLLVERMRNYSQWAEGFHNFLDFLFSEN